MKVIVILVASVGFVFGAGVPVEQPHRLLDFLAEQNSNVRIAGSEIATIENFPWVASLKRGRLDYCSAIIISTNRCLTAAQCTIQRPISSLQLRAGSTELLNGGQLFKLSKIINHPEFNLKTIENDIAVLWIVGSFDTSLPGISVINMPDQGAGVTTGAMANVTGWGAFVENGPITNILLSAALPIVSQEQCKADYANINNVTDGMICAGFPNGGKGPCQGDAGSPLNVGSTLVGLASWSQGCGRPNRPSVFTRIAFYRDWINSNM